MKAMLAAFLAIIAIAVISAYGPGVLGVSTQAQGTGPAVRLGDGS